jgi:hypothetical protein
MRTISLATAAALAAAGCATRADNEAVEAGVATRRVHTRGQQSSAPRGLRQRARRGEFTVHRSLLIFRRNAGIRGELDKNRLPRPT